MLGSAIFFFDWRFGCLPSLLAPKKTRADRPSGTNTAGRDSLVRHVKDPLFIVVTLFLSFLLLAIGYLPVTWFPWLMYLTGGDVKQSNRYTLWYNMSAILGFIIAPACGWIIDYKANRGNRMLLRIAFIIVSAHSSKVRSRRSSTLLCCRVSPGRSQSLYASSACSNR